MTKCICMRVTSTTSSNTHSNSNAVIYIYEIDSAPFGFSMLLVLIWPMDPFLPPYYGLEVICIFHPHSSAAFIWCIYKTMYTGSSGTSYVHLVSSLDASYSSFCILSTKCLTFVDFSRFAHDCSIPSTAFTGVNIPFAAGMPIFVWRHFPMNECYVLKFTCLLRIW